MDEAQIQEWVDQLTKSIESLSPVPEPEIGFWEGLWGSVSFAPLATLAVGILAAILAGLALWQKSRSDARAEWWRRAEWALDARIHPKPEMNSDGKAMMTVLLKSRLAGKEERNFIREVTTPLPVPVATEAPAILEIAEIDLLKDMVKRANPDMSDDDVLVIARRLAAYYAEADDPGVDDRGNEGDNGETETEVAPR